MTCFLLCACRQRDLQGLKVTLDWPKSRMKFIAYKTLLLPVSGVLAIKCYSGDTLTYPPVEFDTGQLQSSGGVSTKYACCAIQLTCGGPMNGTCTPEQNAAGTKHTLYMPVLETAVGYYNSQYGDKLSCCSTDLCNSPSGSAQDPSKVPVFGGSFDSPDLKCFVYSTSSQDAPYAVDAKFVNSSEPVVCVTYTYPCTENNRACTASQLGQTFTVYTVIGKSNCPRLSLIYKDVYCCEKSFCNTPPGFNNSGYTIPKITDSNNLNSTNRTNPGDSINDSTNTKNATLISDKPSSQWKVACSVSFLAVVLLVI